MSNRFVYCDFEFNRTTEEHVQLVCCSLTVDDVVSEYWLHNTSHKVLRKRITDLHKEGYIFVAYAAEAESRSFMALNIDPVGIKWIDLYLEYRMVLNHNHRLMYGSQLIKGKVKKTFPPNKNKWEMTEEDKNRFDSSKPEYGYAAACYNLLGVKVDTVFKEEMRDLIISDPEEFSDEEREDIQKYCTSDIKHLPMLLKRILAEYKVLLPTHERNNGKLLQEMLRRGNYAARTAKMVSKGYPINYSATKAFSESVPDILFDIKREINSLFPDVQPFELDRKYNFVWKQKKTKEWVAAQGHKSWIKTDKGDISLKLEAFKRHYDFSHSYPKDNLGAQFVRFLTLKQNLNGFLPTKPSSKKKNFWDSVGSDERVRPYFGIYGAQSSRSQPSATGFIPLKSAWMRALIQPPKGKAICGIDYSSQEFLITALFYKDMDMIKAYLSSDPYLAFAKIAGAVPPEGTKAEYSKERNLFKATVLGLSYDMSYIGLAKKLTNDTGERVTEAKAKDLIKKFNRSFKGQYLGKQKLLERYREDGYIKLPCGWAVFGDNANDRSVGNVPIQGFGASIMRKAVELAQDSGLDVIYTLHDCLYIEFDSDDKEAIRTLANCMFEAFRFYFKGTSMYEYALIRSDADIWSPDYPEENEYFKMDYDGGVLEVAQKQTYIDPRGESEHEQFKQYLIPREGEIEI